MGSKHRAGNRRSFCARSGRCGQQDDRLVVARTGWVRGVRGRIGRGCTRRVPSGLSDTPVKMRAAINLKYVVITQV